MPHAKDAPGGEPPGAKGKKTLTEKFWDRKMGVKGTTALSSFFFVPSFCQIAFSLLFSVPTFCSVT
jgi:hypothetical protein